MAGWRSGRRRRGSPRAAGSRKFPGNVSTFTALIKKITGADGAAAGNVAWLACDRAFRLGAGLAVGIAVARHLGPAGNGALQAGLSLAAVFAAVLELGLDHVVRRELVRTPERAGALLGTAAALRALALLPAVAAFAWLMQRDGGDTALTAWLAVTLLLPVFLTFESWFLARDRAREDVLAQSGALLLGAVARVALILAGAGVWPFGAAAAGETLLAGVFLALIYRGGGGRMAGWRWDGGVARQLLRDCSPLLLTNLAQTVSRRLDVVLLAALAAGSVAGNYAAAVRLAEIGYVAPMILLNAFFPRLTRLRAEDRAAYAREFHRFFVQLTWLGVAFATVVTVTAPWLVAAAYGPAFADAARPLALYAWTAVLIGQHIARSQWLLLENLQGLGLAFTASGAVVNVLLNLLLIPRLGASGAALAALAAHATALYIAPLPFRRARPVWRLGLRALLLRPPATDAGLSPAREPEALTAVKRFARTGIYSAIGLLSGRRAIGSHGARDVFVVGFPKSGNTWFQYLGAGLMADVDVTRIDDATVQSLVPDVQDVRLYRRAYEPMLFKSHELPQRHYRSVIYLVRDGRDAMVSYFHHFNALHGRIDFETLVRTAPELPARWHEHVDAWLANPYGAELLLVRYEDLKRDCPGELARVCAFLGLPAEPAHLARVSEAASFGRMKEREQTNGWNDPRWPKDKPFVRRGAVGSFRDEMPPAALALFLGEAESTLRKLGYMA